MRVCLCACDGGERGEGRGYRKTSAQQTNLKVHESDACMKVSFFKIFFAN